MRGTRISLSLPLLGNTSEIPFIFQPEQRKYALGIKKGFFDVGQEFDITVDKKNYKGEVCSLPFI